MKKQVRVLITGHVQGIGFRTSVRRAARRLHVTGWVKNNIDGSVEALFQGELTDVNSLLEWCEKGPFLSCVENVESIWQPLLEEIEDFSIRFE